MENNKKLYIFIAIFLVIIIAETTYIIAHKTNNKENTEPKKQEVLDKDKTNESDNEKENDIYGYSVIDSKKDDETSSKIVELHKSGKNKIIAEHSDMIYGITKKHDTLYYYTQSDDSSKSAKKTFYIDLNGSKLQSVELSSGVDIDHYFDSNEEYLFYVAQEKGLKRYNLSTKKEETIYNKKMVFDLFIADSKIYFYAGTETDDISRDGYYTIDFNGENLKDVGMSAYNDAAKSIGYVRAEYEYDYQYLMYNNKKVSLSEDSKKIMYDDKEIYSAKDNKRKIILSYTLNSNEIAIEELEFSDEGLLETIGSKYYTYNLETNKLTETSKDNVYSFSPLYLDNIYNRLNYPPF